jgi:hypothetical protein
MNTKEQMTKALFDNTVKNKVSQMLQPGFEFNGHTDRMPINLYDISFRLFRPTPTYINLEFMASTPIGKYFQPVGFFDADLNIYVLNEFADIFKRLRSSEEITQNAKFLDLKTNALIAAFSWQTIEFVVKIFNELQTTGWKPKDYIRISSSDRFNKRFEANGFISELIIDQEGSPEFCLDDKYEFSGAIGKYLVDMEGNLDMFPTTEHKDLFAKLDKLKLLTAFTRI